MKLEKTRKIKFKTVKVTTYVEDKTLIIYEVYRKRSIWLHSIPVLSIGVVSVITVMCDVNFLMTTPPKELSAIENILFVIYFVSLLVSCIYAIVFTLTSFSGYHLHTFFYEYVGCTTNIDEVAEIVNKKRLSMVKEVDIL